MLALILPSRGLIHSRTLEGILRASSTRRVMFYLSHDNPIPDCFTKPLQSALANPDITELVIIEEDMEVPADALDKLTASKADIAFYDYPLDDGMVTNVFDGITLSGTGLIRFTRKAIEKLLPFTTTEYQINPLRPQMIQNNLKEKYGKHDIDLFYRAQVDHNMSIEQVGTTGHYRVVRMGDKAVNNGCHQIVNLAAK